MAQRRQASYDFFSASGPIYFSFFFFGPQLSHKESSLNDTLIFAWTCGGTEGGYFIFGKERGFPSIYIGTHKSCSMTKATPDGLPLSCVIERPAKSCQVKSRFCCQITGKTQSDRLIPRRFIASFTAAIRTLEYSS